MSEQHYKRLEEIYRDLRLATSFMTDPVAKSGYIVNKNEGGYGYSPVFPLTHAEVYAIAKWKIENLKQELKLIEEEKP